MIAELAVDIARSRRDRHEAGDAARDRPTTAGRALVQPAHGHPGQSRHASGRVRGRRNALLPGRSPQAPSRVEPEPAEPEQPRADAVSVRRAVRTGPTRAGHADRGQRAATSAATPE